jgi:hypothetical protein
MRAGDAAHVALGDQAGAVLGQAGLAVHVLAVPELHALGAQHGRQTHAAVPHALREPPLPLGGVVEQDDGQQSLGGGGGPRRGGGGRRSGRRGGEGGTGTAAGLGEMGRRPT